MSTQQMGETVKLVGAMMRLQHNTKFKGGLDLGGAPSSVASSGEHLEFLQSFCQELKEHLRDSKDADDDEGGEGFGDRDMITAKFAESQIRALVNSELEACVVLHETQEFWQQRLERPVALLRNWLEMGPVVWRSHSFADCGEEYLNRLNRCRQLLRIKVLSAGSLQLHLTHMKQAYMDGKFNAWNRAALVMIRRALSEKEGTKDERPRISLASATPTPDMSPSHPFRRSVSGLGISTRRSSTSFTANAHHGSDASDSPSPNVRSRRAEAGGRSDAAHIDETLVGRLMRLGRESSTGSAARQWTAGGNQAQASAMDHGDAVGSDRGERVESATFEENDEGFVLARDSRVSNDARERRGLRDGRVEEAEEGNIMEALVGTSDQVVKVVVLQQQEMVPILLGSCAKPSLFRRNWVWVTVAAPAVLAGSLYMYRGRSGIRRSLAMVRGSFWQFVREHISEPFWGIYNDLVHNQPLMINNKNALEDSSQSLRRMLETFIKDTRPELPKAEVDHMAATGDMSVVSREYERSIVNAWKNFVAGDIVRMMLIQVQFIKRELLIATTAIGQMARENELNLRMMATVPAFLLAWGAYRGARPVYYLITSEKSRKSTFTAMRTIMLAMERLLSMKHREGTWQLITEDIQTAGTVPRGQAPDGQTAVSSDNCTRLVTVSSDILGSGSAVMIVRVLDELDLGKLMMLIHQFRKLIRSGSRRFERRDLINSQEDLAELVGERGLVSVGQQLQIVQRMQRSYKFLAPPR